MEKNATAKAHKFTPMAPRTPEVGLRINLLAKVNFHIKRYRSKENTRMICSMATALIKPKTATSTKASGRMMSSRVPVSLGSAMAPGTKATTKKA